MNKSIKSTLQTLALNAAKYDIKNSSSFDEDDLGRICEWNYEELQSVRKALLKGHIYLMVESVSKSGMSRTIKIKYIENNKLFGVSDFIYTLAGCDKNNRIHGCGMDMLFLSQYNLFCEICGDKDYTKDMPRYNEI